MRWLPFQLNPDLPVTGISRQEYIIRKWGAKRGPETYARVAGVGRDVGIPFAFESITVQPNTLEAHRLMYFAELNDRQDEMAEVLLQVNLEPDFCHYLTLFHNLGLWVRD